MLPGSDIGEGWWIFDFAEGDLGVHPVDDPRTPGSTTLVLLRRHPRDREGPQVARRRLHEGRRGPRVRARDVLHRAGRHHRAAVRAEYIKGAGARKKPAAAAKTAKKSAKKAVKRAKKAVKKAKKAVKKVAKKKR